MSQNNPSSHVAEVVNPISEPEYLKYKDVFLLNDIAFVIPPTSISVQKEDLSYSWKTLRSPATTKVPTGHGAIRVAVVIPFLNSHLLEFHRLRVEIGHNPFVYIENRFLRESIIPDEPGIKSMAFGVDSFHVSSMAGTADAWVLQLGLTWFNYAPYGPNFLFREEWETNDITEYGVNEYFTSINDEYGAIEESEKRSEIIRKSIGWHLPSDDGKKVTRPSITYVAPRRDTFGESLPGDGSRIPTPLSILEMERLHEGFEWDLLPKASMMRSSPPVVHPYNSRIYTRFYNYLQRDALWENFGIDLEQEFKTAGLDPQGFFGVWDPTQANRRETWGLHTGPVMEVAGEEERRQAIAAWRSVMSSVRQRMLERNGRIHFAYNVYKEVIMPPEWGKGVADVARIKNAAIHSEQNSRAFSLSGERVANNLVQDPTTFNTYVLTKSESTTVANLVSVAPALPAGLGSPIGTATERLTFGELIKKSGEGIKARTFNIAGKPNLKAGTTRLHEGWDVNPLADGKTYVYPIKPGRFSKITRFVDISRDKKIYFTSRTGKTEPLSTSHRDMLIAVMSDEAHKARFAQYGSGLDSVRDATDVATLNSFLTGAMKVGDYIVVRLGNNKVGMFWCNGASQGNTVTIAHDDGSESVYMHLDSFLSNVAIDGRADPSTPFAIMGSTGTYSVSGDKENGIGDFAKHIFTDSDSEVSGSLEQARKSVHAETNSLAPWSFESFGVHLHIEYREPFNRTGLKPPIPFQHGSVTCIPRESAPKKVLVDLKTVFQSAPDLSWREFPADYRPEASTEALQTAVEARIQQEAKVEEVDLEKLRSIAYELAALIDDGWYSYGGSQDTMNIYYKTVIIALRSNVPADTDDESVLAEAFSDTIFTGVSASYNAVISKIPLLGHEFPTLQYLGSNEPNYALEFALIDKESTMDGLSSGGVALEGMRARLQRNARIFREIPNSWSMLCDTFLTRFMGTYKTRDDAVQVNDISDMPAFLEIKKRFVIDRTEVATVEGNPGLSYLSLEMSETSDFDSEKLTNMSSQFEDVQVARENVLERILNLSFTQKDVVALAIAQAANENVFDVTSENYGTFESETALPQNVSTDSIKLRLPSNGENAKLESIIAWIVANEPENRIFTAQKDVDGNVYYMVDAEELGLEILGEGGEKHSLLASEFGMASTGMGRTDRTNVPSSSPVSAKFGIKRIIDSFGSAGLSEAFRRAFDYHVLLVDLNRKASLTLSEDPSRVDGEFQEGGFTIDEARAKLYKQPVVPSMWNAFLTFQVALAVRTVAQERRIEGSEPLLGDPVETYTTNENWPTFLTLHGKDQEAVNTLVAEAKNVRTDIFWDIERKLFDAPMSLFNTIGEGALDALVGAPFQQVLKTANELYRGEGLTEPEQGLNGTVFLDDFYKTANEDMYSSMTIMYFRSMLYSSPGMIDLAKSYVADWNLGIINSLLANEQTGYSPLDSNIGSMKENLSSTGYWSPFSPVTKKNLVLSKIPSLHFYPAQDGDIISISEDGQEELQQLTDNRTQNRGLNVSLIDYGKALIGALSGKEAKHQIEMMFPTVEGLAKWGSPMKFHITREAEEAKIEALRREYASLADAVINDYDVLKLLGLENYSGILGSSQSLQGTEAYPDMHLPAHPFYGDTKDTTPDFYYWNIYDDGTVLTKEHYNRIAQAMAFEVGEAYESMKKLQEGENLKINPPHIKYNNSALAEAERSVIFSAEATDGNFNSPTNKGAMGDVFNSETTPEMIAFEKEASDYEELLNSQITIPNLLKQNKVNITLPLGGEVELLDNPNPITEEQLEALEEKTKQVKKMFGSRQSYLDSLAPMGADGKPNYRTRNAGIESTGHSFSKDSLIKLAEDATKDIFSRKMSMARAFPTFKLYFVEEDEIENGLLSLDDFYSYSGVKEFTFVESKESPASIAIITLQNVSGILDGTKKNVLTDLDYFDKRISKNLEGDRSSLSTDALTEGTNYEQPFGSVVLRPGLNVQLRVGYSNDPRNLEVLLSGRIIDLAWNKNNDLAEITVQSFGTELMQERKGMDPNADEKKKHHTTHHLLGHLMLSPELVHFGRWEVGGLFQTNESKDARLDFTNYSREGLSGRFKLTNKIGSWMANNAGILFALSAMLVAIQLMPSSRALGIGAKGTVAGGKLAQGFFRRMLSKGTFGVSEAIASGLGAGYTAAKGTTGNFSAKASAFSRLFTSTSKKHRAEQIVKSTMDDFFDKAGVSATGRVVDLEVAAQSAAARIGLAKELLAPMLKVIRETKDPRAIKAAIAAIKNWSKKSRAAKTVDELTDISEGARGELQTIYSSLQLLDSPGVGIKEVAVEVWGNKLSAATRVGKLFGKTLLTEAILLMGGYAVGFGLDTLMMTEPVRQFNEKYLKYLGRFFEATKVSFMVSPQDDNLYCPHPKDYMRLKRPSIGTAFKVGGTRIIAGSLVDDTFGLQAANWVANRGLFDKRVDPKACEYVLEGSTIWEVFHEMSLRHPGWAYAARPYGQTFRYTMFFGVPSQRYWSKPGSDKFITRMNLLERILKDDEVSLTEGKELYGDRVHNYSVEEWVQINGENNLLSEYKGMAMKEYLRGMEVRFEPFRRHHHFSSWTDIVWNGLMSSENACNNSVNVTYYDTNRGTPDPKGNQQIKAHTFIPEHLIRMQELPMYRNCTSEEMARRYGMGALLHEMKKMYRGEIILTGNSRIRPWDIGILADSYNDMFGPIEIDQVVHTFSYETGFITEIKPAAITIANEISSWPLIEAAKLASLAMEDVYAVGNTPLKDTAKHSVSEEAGKELDEILGSLKIPAKDMDLIKARLMSLQKNNKDLQDVIGNNESLMRELAEADREIQSTIEVVRPAFLAGGAVVMLGGVLVGGVGARALASKGSPWIAGLLGLGTTAFTLGSGYTLFQAGTMKAPSMSTLLGGSVLLLQCMREQSIMLVPLVKSGRPIVSGLSLKDPTLTWKQFRGQLAREINDTFEGAQDLVNLWDQYSTGAWDKLYDASQMARAGYRIRSEE